MYKCSTLPQHFLTHFEFTYIIFYKFRPILQCVSLQPKPWTIYTTTTEKIICWYIWIIDRQKKKCIHISPSNIIYHVWPLKCTCQRLAFHKHNLNAGRGKWLILKTTISGQKLGCGFLSQLHINRIMKKNGMFTNIYECCLTYINNRHIWIFSFIIFFFFSFSLLCFWYFALIISFWSNESFFLSFFLLYINKYITSSKQTRT